MIKLSVAVALVAALVGGGATRAGADGPGAAFFDGTPSQRWADLASTSPGYSNTQAGWGDLAGGVDDRPYVTSLTVINGAEVTPVITGGTTATADVPAGRVTTAIMPINLCKIGQTPSAGHCYATPNRVALTIGYGRDESSIGFNFGAPGVDEVTPAVGPDTVFDMTVALNTLGRSLRWSWVNGELLYWRTSNLGRPDATVRIRFKPATAPQITQWPDGSGCTATPIFNCSIARAGGESLAATVLFSLDGTLDPALTGAVFATRNAISGYLQPGGGPGAPTLDIQAASSHEKSDGSPQLGTIQAFLPEAALLNMWGVLPGDAPAAFATTRTGSAGTNNPPTYTTWTEGADGSDGLLVTVDGITFSVPKYKVRTKLRATPTKNVKKRGKTVITATVPGCGRKARCLAYVYDLGRGGTRYRATYSRVLNAKPVTSKRLSVSVARATLAKGDRYLLVVRSAKTRKLLVSARGTVR